MNVHVVEYRGVTAHGMEAVLEPHGEGLDVDWRADGVTCDPGLPCRAVSESTQRRCAKREAVVVLEARTKGARLALPPTHELELCGGHLNSHRAGRRIRVLVTTPLRAAMAEGRA